MPQQEKQDSTGVTGPQTPRNPAAPDIEENVEEKGGGPEGVAVPEGWKPDAEGKPEE